MTIEEKRRQNRIKSAKWIKNHPEARERNRLKNIEWRKNNPEKYRKAVADWRIRNPEYEPGLKLKSRYGITPDQYTELLSVQRGRCLICGNEESAQNNRSKKTQKLAVDHCHATGKVRGLLCQDCNRGIAKFREDIARLRKAIAYLTRHSACGSIKQ